MKNMKEFTKPESFIFLTWLMNDSIDDIYINTHQMIDRMGEDEWRGWHGETAESISLDPGLPTQRASSPNHLLT